eukprot:Polyplicarium_translucidae@DN3391_c1_g2_i6.p1
MFVKLAAIGLALVAAEEAGTLPSKQVLVGPVVMCPGHVGNCWLEMPPIEEPCGEEGKPCPASAKKGTEFEECGACYMIEFESSVKHYDCKNLACPEYTKQVLVQIQDFHEGAVAPIMIGGANGWANICPVLCLGEMEACVEDGDSCNFTTIDGIEFICHSGTIENPGSILSSPKEMKVTPHACEGGSRSAGGPKKTQSHKAPFAFN